MVVTIVQPCMYEEFSPSGFGFEGVEAGSRICKVCRVTCRCPERFTVKLSSCASRYLLIFHHKFESMNCPRKRRAPLDEGGSPTCPSPCFASSTESPTDSWASCQEFFFVER